MRTHIIGVGILFLVGACGGGGDNAIEKMEGASAKVGGKDAKVTACKAKKLDGQPAAFFTLDSGHTVVVESTGEVLVGKDGAEPKKADCANFSGGVSTAGSAGGGVWVTGGKTDITCMADSAEVTLRFDSFDCGAKDRPSNEKK